MISNVGTEPTIKAGFGGAPSVDYKLPITGLNVTPKITDTITITIPSNIKDYEKAWYRDWETDRKSTRLNSSHITRSRMPSSA